MGLKSVAAETYQCKGMGGNGSKGWVRKPP